MPFPILILNTPVMVPSTEVIIAGPVIRQAVDLVSITPWWSGPTLAFIPCQVLISSDQTTDAGAPNRDRRITPQGADPPAFLMQRTPFTYPWILRIRQQPIIFKLWIPNSGTLAATFASLMLTVIYR